MAGRVGRRAAEVKSFAAAAKPFYNSPDDTQLRNAWPRDAYGRGRTTVGGFGGGSPRHGACQRIGIGSNRRRQIRFDGTFVRVRLSGEGETPLQRAERCFRQDRDDTIQKAAQAYTKMMAGKPRFWMVVTMD